MHGTVFAVPFPGNGAPSGLVGLSTFPISTYGDYAILLLCCVKTNSNFEWESRKDALNQHKHAVPVLRAPCLRFDFVLLVPDFGEHAARNMKRKTKNRNKPPGELEVVTDFLPAPDKLVLRDDGVKITISLSRRSVEFFKRHAARSKVPYQKMIRSLLDGYAKHHER